MKGGCSFQISSPVSKMHVRIRENHYCDLSTILVCSLHPVERKLRECRLTFQVPLVLRTNKELGICLQQVLARVRVFVRMQRHCTLSLSMCSTQGSCNDGKSVYKHCLSRGWKRVHHNHVEFHIERYLTPWTRGNGEDGRFEWAKLVEAVQRFEDILC